MSLAGNLGEGLLLWTGGALEGHCWFSDQSGALTLSHSLRLLVSHWIGAFSQANLISLISLKTPYVPPPGQLFCLFVCGIQSSVSLASHPRPGGAVPCLHTRCPDTSGLVE